MSRLRHISRRLERPQWQAPIAVSLIVALALLLAGAYGSATRAERARLASEAALLHTFDVLRATDEAKIAALQALRGERGYLLTDDPSFLSPLHVGRDELARTVPLLRRLTSDNPAQQERVRQLEERTRDYVALIDRMVALQASGERDVAIARVRNGEGRQAVESMTSVVDAMEAEELRLWALRAEASTAAADLHGRFVLILTILGGLLLILSALALYNLRQAFRREEGYRSELRRLAQTDELTGLSNRRELIAAVDRALATAGRSGEPVSVAILDIDRFKQVNDRYGHPAGDEVIRRIATAALAAVRGGDIVGRLGGEEFAIVLPGADPQVAWSVCERLRKRVHAERIVLGDGRSLSVTLSSGVAGLRASDSGDTLLARADEALYAAKNGGRDQVRLAA